jgi:peptidyl-tRNA hydrolase
LPPYLSWLRGEPVGDPLLDPWDSPVRRVPLVPETFATWTGATARAGARLAAWEGLQHALAGEDGEDETRLAASLRAMAAWLGGRFTKVCVYVTSDDELLAVMQRAADAGLPHALSTDAGHTEFHGVPTRTCGAVGPAWSDDVDAITGALPLL